MSHNWVGVASAEHVRRGREEGFMQLSHGKLAPLRRVSPGDHIAYYSPTLILGDKSKLQSFTSIGVIEAGEPYQVDMGGGFLPYRRDVLWLPSQDVAIQALLNKLEFSAGQQNWGYQFRFGLFAISDHDIALIATAMMAKFPK